jgi:hypothetical protein
LSFFPVKVNSQKSLSRTVWREKTAKKSRRLSCAECHVDDINSIPKDSKFMETARGVSCLDALSLDYQVAREKLAGRMIFTFDTIFVRRYLTDFTVQREKPKPHAL